MFTLRPLILLLCLLPFSACSATEERAPSLQTAGASLGGSTSRLSPISADRNSKEYPAGPYSGVNPEVGETLENLSFFGFISSENDAIVSNGKFAALSLSEIRDSDAQYLLIHVSAFWCPTCLVAAESLNDYVDEIRRAGGAVLELLVDGQASGADPLKEELEIWIDTAELSMTTVGPGDDRVRDVFKNRDYVYIVEIDSMQVVWRLQGLGLDPSPAEIAARELLDNWLID